jgi:HEAT repeat protein
MDVVGLYMSLLVAGAVLTVAFTITLVAKRAQRNVAERRRRERAAATREALAAYGPAVLPYLVVEARGSDALIELGADIDLLWSELDKRARLQLVATLDQSGFVDRLIRQTSSRVLVRRVRAAHFLGQARFARAIPALRRLLLAGDLPDRVVAARALRRIGTRDAADALLEGVRTGALPPARLAELFAGGWANARIVAALVTEPVDEPARATLLEAAGLAHAEAADEVLRSFASATAEVRIAAARTARRLVVPGAVTVLCQCLQDPDWRVAAQSARSLGALGDPAAAFALETAAHDPAWWVRANAADALARLGESGRQALDRLLRSDDRYAAERAREALAAAADFWEAA